jgi:O-antigen ligase
MGLGYLPVLAISNRQVNKEYFQAALFSALVLVAIVVLAQSTLSAGTFFGECRLDKCSAWGMSIGNLSSGNALGLGFSFLGIMAVALATTTKAKSLLAIAMFVLIDGSSGRTATFSFVLATALFIGTSLAAKTRFRRSAIVSITVVASLVFAIFPFDSEDFTRRGELWIFAREQISSNLFFGFGASGWVRQNGSSSYFLNYSSHNIWLEAAFSIGLVGLVLFFVMFMRQKGLWDPAEVIQLALFFWIVISGLTEVPSFITRIYLVPSALVFYFMLGSLAKNQEFRYSNLKIPRARKPKIFNR